MSKVNFLICGAQKGGTSALDAYLRCHPSICMAEKKELHFFDKEEYFASNNPPYDIYHSYFTPERSGQLLGESTPIYMYWYSSPRRIFEYNPMIKLIVLLRNPIERAYSHWNMEKAKGTETLGFSEAICAESDRLKESLPYQHRVHSYTDRGFYLEQLRRLWFYFPRENILILKHEYLKEQPSKALLDITNFLGVPPFAEIFNKNVHAGVYHSEMEMSMRIHLQRVFEFEIRGLERVLGWDCRDWLAT